MSGRAIFLPVLSAVAGVLILAIAVGNGQLVSVASVLGILLVVGAALRLEIARRE